MKKRKVVVFLFFLSIIWRVRSEHKYDATVIDEIRNKLLQHETMLEDDLLDRRLYVISLDEGDLQKYVHLIKSFKTFGDELDEKFPTRGYENLDALSSIWLWAQTRNELKAIDGLYNIFRQMQHEIIDENAKIDLQKLADFSEAILHDPNASIIRPMTRVTQFIVHDKLFVSAYQDSSTQICSEQQSFQQLLYNLYSTVTLAEIKGYSMIQFSYMLLRLYNPGSNFTNEMELIKQQYATRTIETLKAAKIAMAFAPRDLWRCDATKHKLDETYTQLTRLFQGYLINEKDLSKDKSCTKDCAYYTDAKVYQCTPGSFCTEDRTCAGEVVHCEYFTADMWVCPSAWSSDRRYEYIEYENGLVLGQKGTCKNNMIRVESWWYWLFWRCSYCFCYCDDHSGTSDRYFSLRDVVSDVANNKVVTGIAFKKVRQIMHIRIQEGELLPRGNINKTTVSWKPIKAFSRLDKGVRENIDYHTLSWRKKGLDLDDLVPAQDHLLTGVRFRTLGSHLNLEIRVTPFNFTTGKLLQPLEKSYWLSNDLNERNELKLISPDIPIRHPIPSLPDSKANQYLNFAASDRVNDAAQNTVPFIDIQPVESKVPVPMAGAGIYHKGRPGSGGFVALKLITYDFTPHLQVDLPSETPVIETLSKIKAV